MPETPAEGLLRELTPQVLGALVRRFGHFDTAEDAVQEAAGSGVALPRAEPSAPDTPPTPGRFPRHRRRPCRAAPQAEAGGLDGA
ncbi:hypothetical protein ACLQ24_19020 [Micromonospora sp. DT4]|uniref:hypothetical protein n=1 Tax=Micromonospora sp. DT4 TaxID=3393438 RepID=UPI003CF4675B